MRLYSFVNFYLSSIQQGIQTAHVLQELNNEYGRKISAPGKVLFDWARDHKTIIVLNGGTRSDVEKTYFRLKELCIPLGLPFSFFHEDDDSLGGIVTCCAAVIPEVLYGATPLPAPTENSFAFIRPGEPQISFWEDTPEWELIRLIRSFNLAR
jgi:hypothetical protein